MVQHIITVCMPCRMQVALAGPGPRAALRREGAQKEGMRREGAQQEGTQQEGTQQEGMRQEGTQQEGMRQEGMRPQPARPPQEKGLRAMALKEKLDAVDEYLTGDSLYTVAARHGLGLAAARRLVENRALVQENERRRRRLLGAVCGARPPVRPVCRGCMWGNRATGLCTQPRCPKKPR